MGPRTVRVGDGVTMVMGSHTNFVVVEEGDAVTLVDTGYPRDRDRLVTALEGLGRSLAHVEGLVLTHAHVDHLGSARWLAETHGVPVSCHDDEAPQATGEVVEQISELELARRIWRPRVLRFTANALTAGALWAERLDDVGTFADGEALDLPGSPVTVHTPGHTRGHTVVHLPDRGVLLTGDALITVDVWDERRRGPQVIHRPFNADHDQAWDSLERIAGLEADAVVPGHGRPYRGTPAQAVAEARRGAAA